MWRGISDRIDLPHACRAFRAFAGMADRRNSAQTLVQLHRAVDRIRALNERVNDRGVLGRPVRPVVDRHGIGRLAVLIRPALRRAEGITLRRRNESVASAAGSGSSAFTVSDSRRPSRWRRESPFLRARGGRRAPGDDRRILRIIRAIVGVHRQLRLQRNADVWQMPRNTLLSISPGLLASTTFILTAKLTGASYPPTRHRSP